MMTMGSGPDKRPRAATSLLPQKQTGAVAHSGTTKSCENAQNSQL